MSTRSVFLNQVDREVVEKLKSRSRGNENASNFSLQMSVRSLIMVDDWGWCFMFGKIQSNLTKRVACHL